VDSGSWSVGDVGAVRIDELLTGVNGDLGEVAMLVVVAK
jgi:hypothetical protein